MKTLVLGSGMKQYDKDTTTIDMKKFKGVDIICDVSRDRFPFKNNAFDFIIAEHLFEHLGWTDREDGLIHCLDECFRVIKPSGRLFFIVPCFPSDSALAHPEHKRFFVRNSFAFFHVPSEGKDCHGYLKGFWHPEFIEEKTSENYLVGYMYPNKKGKGSKYPYVKVRRTLD